MIIFLYGPDGFRAREKLKQLKQKFIREVDKSGLNLIELDGEKMGLNDFNKAIFTQSFLARKRMIVVKNVFKKNKASQTEILAVLKQAKLNGDKTDDNILIFMDEEPDKRVALFKYLSGVKFKEEFKILVNNELEQWIRRRVADKGGKIGTPASAWLASKSDGNLWVMAGEIDKLVALRRGQEIRTEDVAEIGLAKIDDNIFNLGDAIANKNKPLALKLIDEQIESGVNEIYLLTMIVRQFRILIQIKSAIAAGINNNRQMAGELGLHPFVVQKARPQSEQYTMEQLKRIYEKLVETDLKMKLGGEARVLLELFIVKS